MAANRGRKRSPSKASQRFRSRSMSRATSRRRRSILKKTGKKPQYWKFITEGIRSIKAKNGASREDLLKYIMRKHKNVGNNKKVVNSRLSFALRAALNQGRVRQERGKGQWGGFTLPGQDKKVTLVTPKHHMSKSRATSKARRPSKTQSRRRSPAKKSASKRRSAPGKKVVKRLKTSSRRAAKPIRRRY